jgi:hypothetical protein
MKVSGETVKNLYTLYFLQRRVLRQRSIKESLIEKIREMMGDSRRA